MSRFYTLFIFLIVNSFKYAYMPCFLLLVLAVLVVASHFFISFA